MIAFSCFLLVGVKKNTNHSRAAAVKLILPVFHSNPQSLTNMEPSVVYMFAYLACNAVERESGALSLTGFSLFIIIYEIGARYLRR